MQMAMIMMVVVVVVRMKKLNRMIWAIRVDDSWFANKIIFVKLPN